ncbi:hypothetical protein [Ruminococcus flavefaciens]|uniref:hypothetical protein n=1 Tax=Ruminococcus flavefaciens TaxID=1265 RepID=UPI00030C6388|nr:hypothetical protein [Ruminococcus flavefaciens]
MAERTFDLRRGYLSELLKDIFGYKTVGFEEDGKNTGIIYLGGKTETNDCTFTERYKKKYQKLFEVAFIYEHCTFTFGNEKIRSKKVFSRENVIDNTIKYFKEFGADIDYQFNSVYEQKLFSKLLYRYICNLLDCLFLFDDPSCEKDKQCEEKYLEMREKIKRRVSGNEIIDLIYSRAELTDIETYFDSEYEENECCDYFLYYQKPNYKEMLVGVYVDAPQKKGEIGIKIHSADEKAYRIHYSRFDNKYLIKLVNRPVRYKSSSFVCLKTNYSNIDKVEYNRCDPIFLEPVDMETKENEIAYDRIFPHLPPYQLLKDKDEYDINELIGCIMFISRINYEDFFENNKIPNELKNRFVSFETKIKKYIKIDKCERKVFFVFLFYCWINNIWRVLEKYIGTDIEKEIKKGISELDLDYLKKAEKTLETFCNNNYDLIEKYKGHVYGTVDFGPEGMIAKKDNRQYNPLSHLIETINIIKGD